VERDRYGLVAQVLLARDRCTATQCAAFRALTDSRQIVANMEEHTYDAMVTKYAALWNAPAASAPVAMLSSSIATGRPTNADFPTAASTPAVSIMTPEPGSAPAPQRAAPPASAASPSSAANASLLSPRPTSSVAPAAPAAAKKPAAPKRLTPPSPPVQTAPPAAAAGSSE
jgi:hypothetical protein